MKIKLRISKTRKKDDGRFSNLFRLSEPAAVAPTEIPARGCSAPPHAVAADSFGHRTARPARHGRNMPEPPDFSLFFLQ